MEWTEFVSAMTAHLAWPVGILIALLVLRRPIGRALRSHSITDLAVGPQGVSASFERQVAAATVATAESARVVFEQEESELSGEALSGEGSTGTAAPANGLTLEKMRQVTLDPHESLLEDLEHLRQALAVRLNLDPWGAETPGLKRLTEAARAMGALTRAETKTVTHIRKLGELVERSGNTPEVPVSTAATTAFAVAAIVDSLTHTPHSAL